jgi:hypothetical protein
MAEQPHRLFIIGWLCDMKMIQFVKVMRAAGTLKQICSPVIELLDITKERLAPGSGLFGLARLMLSSCQMHSFLMPKGAAKVLASGGSAVVFEREDGMAMKHYMAEFLPYLRWEVEILNALPTLFARPASLLDKGGKSVARISKGLTPPIPRLVELLQLDGSVTTAVEEATTIVSQPLCCPLSRLAFHNCKRQHVVLDFVNTLWILHTGGIRHNDIRPSNLMLTPEGRGIIIDYGLAVTVQQGDHLYVQDLVRLVLVVMYWCTNNRLIASVKGPILNTDDIRESVHKHWVPAVDLALAGNYAELTKELMRLVEKIEQPTIVLNGESPPDKSLSANQDAKKTREQGEHEKSSKKGKGKAPTSLFGDD